MNQSSPRNGYWLSQDLEQSDHWHHALSKFEQQSLIQALTQSIEGRCPLEIPIEKLHYLWQKVRFELEFGPGIYLIRHLPLPELSTDEAKTLLLRISWSIGSPVFQDNRQNQIVDIRATETPLIDAVTYKHRQDGTYSRPYETRAAFTFHSDPCDVAGLMCLSTASKGGTSFFCNSFAIHETIKESHPEEWQQLYRPYPYARPGNHQEGKRNVHEIPVFSQQKGHFKAHIVPELIRISQTQPGVPRLSTWQKSALSVIENVATQKKFCFFLKLLPGDLILMNNHLVFHGRDTYQDIPDQHRHLLRVWLSVPNSRPLHPIHQHWFGNPFPGAIRGGYFRSRPPVRPLTPSKLN